MKTTFVAHMTPEELQKFVLGQPLLSLLEDATLDWCYAFPVIDHEGVITDVVDAFDDEPEGMRFDEHLECYVIDDES